MRSCGKEYEKNLDVVSCTAQSGKLNYFVFQCFLTKTTPKTLYLDSKSLNSYAQQRKIRELNK
jgi:hypothetical protein